MKLNLLVSAALISCSACLLSCKAKNPSEPTISSEAIPAENMVIYRDLLPTGTQAQPHYVLDLTMPFRPNTGAMLVSCVQKIRPFGVSSNTVHRFPANAFQPPNEVVTADNTKLLDFSNAMQNERPHNLPRTGPCEVKFSEIVFNSAHTRAALSVVLTCYVAGGPQSLGAIPMFEKRNGAWRFADSCGNWMS